MLFDKRNIDNELKLSCFNIEDQIDKYISWLNDTNVNRYLEVRHTLQDENSVREFINFHNKSHKSILFGIFYYDSLIGTVKLDEIDLRNSHAVMGIMLGERSVWGKGIASRVIKYVTEEIAFSQLKLNKIIAGCYSSNIGSKKAFLKANYEVEGVIKNYWKTKDGYEDDILLGRENREIK